jgi:hypothetical protein
MARAGGCLTILAANFCPKVLIVVKIWFASWPCQRMYNERMKAAGAVITMTNKICFD